MSPNLTRRPSPLANRISPFGAERATPARGGWIGNRGVIHEGWRITRRASTDGWVCCALSFKNRKRPMMRPGRWTELFFLDEATAFAAGHRPCFYCRRPAAKAFAAAWGAGNGLARAASAREMDAVLKTERMHVGRRRAAERQAHFAALPRVDGDQIAAPGPAASLGAAGRLAAGAIVAEETGEKAFLYRGERFLEWGLEGYAAGEPQGPLRLLTPLSALAAFHAGYAPEIHPSASALSS